MSFILLKLNTDSVLWSTARLWTMILQSRLINNYGTANARLDRFVAIGDCPPLFQSPYVFAARLSFGVARAHLHRCSRAWADRIAYTEEWNQFKSKNQRDWDMTAGLVSTALFEPSNTANLLNKSLV